IRHARTSSTQTSITFLHRPQFTDRRTFLSCIVALRATSLPASPAADRAASTATLVLHGFPCDVAWSGSSVSGVANAGDAGWLDASTQRAHVPAACQPAGADYPSK